MCHIISNLTYIVRQDTLGLKGPKREAMYQLPTEQKQYLFRQHRAASMSKGTTVKRPINHAAQSSTYSPASAIGTAARIAPQSTGDSGIWKRFSISGWGAVTTSPSTSPRASAEFVSSSTKADSPDIPIVASPIQPQTTGGLWSSWWASSGGDKAAASSDKTQQKDLAKNPGWYVDGIRRGKSTDMKLVKHLISLRVHLSTADLVWIEEFVSSAKGMESLGTLLAGLVAKNGQRKKLQNVEETVLLEVIKCVRVLLNTDVGNPFSIWDWRAHLYIAAGIPIWSFQSYIGYTSGLLVARIFNEAQGTHFRRACCHLLCVTDGRS